jgi:hypothetical protein
MFKLSDTVRRTETSDGEILLDIHHGQMFCLNLVGAKVVELLERGWDEEGIAREIGRAYAMDAGTVQADVHEFIETLNKHHILQIRSAAGGL